jgi:hypothetical protein
MIISVLSHRDWFRNTVNVVGPPQALQGHDDVVASEVSLAGELELVGHRVQRCNCLAERR